MYVYLYLTCVSTVKVNYTLLFLSDVSLLLHTCRCSNCGMPILWGVWTVTSILTLPKDLWHALQLLPQRCCGKWRFTYYSTCQTTCWNLDHLPTTILRGTLFILCMTCSTTYGDYLFVCLAGVSHWILYYVPSMYLGIGKLLAETSAGLLQHFLCYRPWPAAVNLVMPKGELSVALLTLVSLTAWYCHSSLVHFLYLEDSRLLEKVSCMLCRNQSCSTTFSAPLRENVPPKVYLSMGHWERSVCAFNLCDRTCIH